MAIIAIAVGRLLFGCRPAPPEHAGPLPPVANLRAVLEDEVRSLPQGRIAWSTYWKLCWPSYPGARGYELQVLTSEGTSPRLRPQAGRCFRLQLAAGQNARAQGLLHRDQLLGLQAGQLSYRVRAVLGPGQYSGWSKSVAAGSPEPAAPAQRASAVAL